MTRLLAIAIIALSLSLLACSSHSNNPAPTPMSTSAGNIEQLIFEQEEERQRAMAKRDIETISRLCSDDFISVNEDGDVVTKARDIEYIKAGGAGEVPPEIINVRTKIYGNTAIMTAHYIWKGIAPARYTTIWVNQNGRWQLVAEQGTRMPPFR